MISKLTNTLEFVIKLLLMGMFVMTAVLVVLRYLFGSTIVGGNEATVVAFVYTTAIGASIALFRDEHISIDYFVEKLSPQSQIKLERLRFFLLAALNFAIFIYAITWIQRTGGFMMPTLGVPQMVAQFSIPLGSALGVFYCTLRLVRKQ